MEITRGDREPIYKAPFTDPDGNFDGGSIWVAVSVFALIALSAYSVVFKGQPFNPAELGMGVGSVLGGWAFYKWGDSRDRSRHHRHYGRIDIPDDR
jgi:hypothetical protein